MLAACVPKGLQLDSGDLSFPTWSFDLGLDLGHRAQLRPSEWSFSQAALDAFISETQTLRIGR
jgi:hypothetical protein